jgi:hypothetical protein
MRRAYVLGLIGLAIVFFLFISALLARGFSVSGAKNAAITALVTAEARGKPSDVIALITGCHASPGCSAQAAQNATTLKRSGSVSIIQITPTSGFSVAGSLGTARVAWLVGGSLPRVQCILVRESGDLLAGFSIHLLKVSARIKTNRDCPSHF